jgi:hypothetical protein
MCQIEKIAEKLRDSQRQETGNPHHTRVSSLFRTAGHELHDSQVRPLAPGRPDYQAMEN